MSRARDLIVTIELLASFPAKLKQLFECFPMKRVSRVPTSWEGMPGERLTAIETICHVLDVEREGYQARFERILSESTPALPDLQGERMAVERNYAGYDSDEVFIELARARLDTVDTINRFTQDELNRSAVFENRLTTLAGLVHLLSSHDFQHLAGLQWLLGRVET